MDNAKTGTLIRELRKEKGMTQKALAEQLHITDRAVSKWERGLCAPDISLLEPLTKILDISIAELIEGKRAEHLEHIEVVEESTKLIIAYSQNEIAHKVGKSKRKHLLIAIVCVLVATAALGVGLWRGGYFFVIDKVPSPDENYVVTVYNKALDGGGFSMRDGVSLIVKHSNGGDLNIVYGDSARRDCAYRGLWWAPDSKKYVIELEYDDGVYLALAWIEMGSESNLSAYLSMGVEATELKKYGFVELNGWPEIEYRFLQWGLDSASMLIYYSFEDDSVELHDGYFWYNCETGQVSAVLELGDR